MKRISIIMAGGSGERFWPLSRKNFPKQLLHLNSADKSILEEALLRISSLIKFEDIFIITNELLVSVMRKSLPMLPPENIIPEPCKRNTAACLALASGYIAARYSLPIDQLSVAILTADQNISPENKFAQTIEYTMDYAEKNSMLLTVGIPPTRPETGYGYIETINLFESNDKLQIQKVIKFREKPNLAQAIEFIKTEKFTWNSGMFFWRHDMFLSEMKTHCPEIGNKIEEITNLLQNKTHSVHDKLPDDIISIFSAFPSISIDYALMEKSQNVAVCKANFEWDDIGSWDSLDRTKLHDDNFNIIQGDISLINSHNSIVINECKNKDMIVAGLELQNMVVVVTDDAVLVCPKDKVQDIKKNVENIRSKFGETYL